MRVINHKPGPVSFISNPKSQIQTQIHMNIIRKIAVVAALAASVGVSTAQLSGTWTGGGASQNWSDGANWYGGVTPSAVDVLYFEDIFFTGYTNAAKVINNIVDTNLTVASVNYTSISHGTATVQTNHFYTTAISANKTLTVGGFGPSTPTLVVGDVPGALGWLGSGNWTNYATVTGSGTLFANDSAGMISVSMRNRATLDLTGLDTFNANVAQVRIGASSDNPFSSATVGYLLLAKTNTITTAPNSSAPGIFLGRGTNANATGIIVLGKVNNFNTDALVVGGPKSSSGVSISFTNGNSGVFITHTGFFKLRGSAGGITRAGLFSVGDISADFNTLQSCNATSNYVGSANGSFADFNGGTVDSLKVSARAAFGAALLILLERACGARRVPDR